jgi:short-subunit dehydrogenase
MTYRGAYNATKFALEGLADTLRLELYGTGIVISLIEPGPILSDFRKNALALYEKNINTEHSVHRETYLKMISRLKKEGPAAPFTLPAQAVVDKVIHAVESPHPKSRYFVTFPTYLFAFLKLILPTSCLDYLLRKI